MEIFKIIKATLKNGVMTQTKAQHRIGTLRRVMPVLIGRPALMEYVEGTKKGMVCTTSNVEKVEYYGDKLIIHTKNTIYHLEKEAR